MSTSSIKKVHLTLSQAFEQAIKNNLIYGNPCKAVTVPKTGKREAKSMTIEEQEHFIKNCAGSTYGNMFVFALNTGMRIGEIRALIWSDIDLEKMTISVNKTASEVINRDENPDSKTKMVISSPKSEKGKRKVPINKAAEEILKKQQQKGGVLVFTSLRGAIISKGSTKTAFDNILKKAGVSNDFTVHSLRHTFATRLLEKGANVKVVSEILGHSSIQITYDVYGHVTPNQKKDTISLLD